MTQTTWLGNQITKVGNDPLTNVTKTEDGVVAAICRRENLGYVVFKAYSSVH